MRHLLSLFSPRYPTVLVYMLQSVEYQPGPYLKWFARVHDFSKVMYRKTLDPTKAARLLRLALRIGMAAQFVIGALGVYYGYVHENFALLFVSTLMVMTYPILWAYLIVVPLLAARVLIVNPKNRRRIKASRTIFRNHPGVTIAVAGSYGKTSMKELLKTVLSEGKKVAATPANRNVSSSHAIFAAKLKGDEDILIIEYGEGAPGDVARFADITSPDIGIITGLAPAHLDQYPSLEAAGRDIFSLTKKVGPDATYVNTDSAATEVFMKTGFHAYDSKGVLGWKISNIKIDFTGTSFVMKKGSRTLKLSSGLLGQHQVGPLALVAALADTLGLSLKDIEAGIARTKAFEHRMQPRAIHGAWILDDTYNGNIDGMKAGLALLKALPGKRKIYVTPGLVDQGVETKRVHEQLGEAIGRSSPDKVVLMQNSATKYIQNGLIKAHYQGKVQVEQRPLEFYMNIDHFIASGDVVMMQNDLPDNYN